MSRRLVGVVALVVVSLAASAAYAERPRSVLVPQAEPLDIRVGAIPYNKIYLNSCQPNGCNITVGASNSITNKWNISAPRTLTKFPYDAATWDKVVSCVKDTFSPFNVEITTTDPSPGNHFEIMIAGYATDLGMGSNIGGVAPGGVQCGSYQNNALVFDFAAVWSRGLPTCSQSCVEDICSTAAQEIAHAWSLDHVTDASDPMTYNPFTGRRYFQNVANKCGSDCVNGHSPYSQSVLCGGVNGQERTCYPCQSTSTQNSYTLISSFFGLGPGTPPTVTITKPKAGASVQAGFVVAGDATDDSLNVTRVELRVDGTLVDTTMTKPPYTFTTATTLAVGTHHLEVTAYDIHGTAGTATSDAYIGPPCETDSGCERENDVCVGGRCVPGAGAAGGLGTNCEGAADCLSGRCETDGTNSYCVEPCSVGQCPSDFGCLDVGAGDGTGICWPGYDDGSGGCGCDSNRPGAPLTMGLLLAVVVFTWRRRRR